MQLAGRPARPGTYVEVLRNVPPLLVIVFVNSAALASLPPIEDATDVGGVLLLSVRQVGITVPRGDGFGGLYLVVLALGRRRSGGLVARWRGAARGGHGPPGRRWAWGTGSVAVIAVVGLRRPRRPDRAVAARGRGPGGRGRGGDVPAVRVGAVGLVLYTSSHVAEIVRGSILAVPRGQSEAATAIGLSNSQRLRYVVLPQAFRVAVPPIANQFLNLAKNTSLGVAVAYPEALYVTNTVIGNGDPAIQSMLVVMSLYLVLSLAISLVLNVANHRLRAGGALMTATDALAEPVAPVAVPEPPSRELTPAQWVRANLFSSPAQRRGDGRGRRPPRPVRSSTAWPGGRS